MKKILLIFLIVSTVSIAEVPFKDMTDEHWAYKAVENLLDKGVLKKDSDVFMGKNGVTRYEFAYYLSKTLNKMDSEKAGRGDLAILESLVYEFGKELNKVGFDSELYISKAKNVEERIDLLNNQLVANQKIIAELQKRIEDLEKKIK